MNESFWSYKDCNNSDPYIHIEIYLNCKVNIQNFNLCKNFYGFLFFMEDLMCILLTIWPRYKAPAETEDYVMVRFSYRFIFLNLYITSIICNFLVSKRYTVLISLVNDSLDLQHRSCF